MTTLVSRMTASDFLASDHAGLELVDGEPRENPMSDLTSWLAGELFRRMANFAVDRGLGRVYPQETGISVWDDDPSRVRKPDAMFIRQSRLQPIGPGWVTVAPDLAVEVVSPNDLAAGLELKLVDYTAAGIPLVWVIYPEARRAHVHRRGQPVEILDASGTLSGDDVLPGFSLSLAEFFAAAEAATPLPEDRAG